ncbi:hypothetical protein KIN20_001227 [Parelaphostrongylus tenuis]|uniref:Uncharacterized protein n=1 Tax=Parelaphostrongylus tenuis TaxID=148309 RepID=A0AAD5MCA5_PARTN|nr:hypothetical protein KIN20_001227 [Parelaphostrongylus tenuis]
MSEVMFPIDGCTASKFKILNSMDAATFRESVKATVTEPKLDLDTTQVTGRSWDLAESPSNLCRRYPVPLSKSSRYGSLHIMNISYQSPLRCNQMLSSSTGPM